MNDRPLSDFDATVLGQMGHIRAVGRKQLRNQNELDDFVQETVARVYANRAQLRDPAKLKQWIAGIARNTANEMNRAGFRKREEPLPEEDDLPDMRNPHDELERAERNDQIRQAMNRLNPIDRDLLQGRYMEEESYADLQERHGLSYSAVGFRLHRAKRRLRKLLTGMKVALALALSNMKRTAFGGMPIMTKTTKIVLGVASALIPALLGGYLWIEYGDSPDDSARELTVEEPRLTAEEQSPIVKQKSAETPKQTAEETSAPERQEEMRVFGDSIASEESAARSDGSESVGTTQPDALQAAPQDLFTVELQEGVSEFKEVYQRLVELHPGPRATYIAALHNEVVDSMMEYNEELQDQNLERAERAARLAARLLETAQRLEPQYTAMLAKIHPEEKKAYAQFIKNNTPRKLFVFLGLLPE
ncbi:MAG: sigma-70 family RNA polymerase sigma factor [Candidatus Poribacteria bacterium]|nr:sigma-70 family RNA polymerase sigma factor [Candidatus Poribacteria bacterium]